jgi:aspyridone synthetase (hybrid polyketide synthase/nonribosomal peptide synthetase)
VDRWFAALDELGITYDGVFRAMSVLNRVWSMAEASARWDEGALGHAYALHPAVLDVGFQIGFATFVSQATSTTIVALPTHIGRLVAHTSSRGYQSPGGCSVDVQARLANSTRSAHETDIIINGPSTTEAEVEIYGLEMRTITEPQPSEDRLIFAKTLWDADVAYGFPSSRPAQITNQELAYIEAIERTNLFYLRNVCCTIPEEARKALQPRYPTMFRGIKILLDPSRRDQQPVLKEERFNDNSEDIEKLQTRFQDSVDLALLTSVGGNLPSVVRGESEMLEHMLKDDLLGRLYSEGRGFSECNRHVASLMKMLTHKFPRTNVLEIGAGTGGTTRSVLEAIDGAFASYTYTDVSSGFFEQAMERFRHHADRMDFKRFNVEATPASQGFMESSYEIIIAANVLHATRDILQTVRHVRSLLCPGGFLVAVEVTGIMLRETGLMAGLEGWWLGADDGRFPLPGISAS